MKYTQFIILLCVSLLLIITSGICLGSISKLSDKSSSKKSMTSSAAIVMVIGIIVFLISIYTFYTVKSQTIKPIEEVSMFSQIIQTLLGVTILVCGIIIQNSASALDESTTEKRNILNSSTAIIVVGSVLTGKLILDKYNTALLKM